MLILLIALQVAAQEGKPVQLSPEECLVWQRELSFAQSVDRHDAAAFASHLHPDALFNATTPNPVRGKANVIAAWAGIVEGKRVQLRWRPHTVHIAGAEGRVAVSRGPFVLTNPRPDGKAVYATGEFTSVWVKDARSGEWHVLFDGGGPPPSPAKDEADAMRVLQAAPAGCVAMR